MEERRRNKRLLLQGKIAIKPIGGGSMESVPISITDCSRTGLGFITDKKLVTGDNYEAYLTIWTKEVLYIFIKVVRSEEVEGGYSYGCLFIGMTETERQRIGIYETISTNDDFAKTHDEWTG